LVASASVFLAAERGIPHYPEQHAAYVSSWINVLKQDKNEIFRAAHDASRAADFCSTVRHVLDALKVGIRRTPVPAALATVVFDIVSGAGTATHLKEHIRLSPGEGSRSVRYQFVLDADVVQAETRVYVAQPNEVWEMSLPNLKRRL
jgi:hypothetical protein